MNAPTSAPQANAYETQTPAEPGEMHADLGPDSSNQEPSAKDKAQRRKENRQKDLLEMREDHAIKKRRIRRISRLARYRADLVVLRRIGATYAEIALWLKKKKKVTVSTTTVIRYLAGLPEFRKNSAEDEE